MAKCVQTPPPRIPDPRHIPIVPTQKAPPMPKPRPARPPLQFKRATARTFYTQNPVLLKGEPAFEWDTHNLKVGDGVTDYRNLPYIGGNDGKDGKSAYELWIDAGNTGSLSDFLDSLIGPDGKSTYEIWLSLGHEGTLADFIADMEGASAYEVWLQEGHTGTVTDFLDSLVGASAYDIWIATGHQGTEEDFIESLKGDSAYDIWLQEGHQGTPEDFLNYMKTESWEEF